MRGTSASGLQLSSDDLAAPSLGAADGDEAYMELLKALSTDVKVSTEVTSRVSARQRETAERLSRLPAREPKPTLEVPDPMKECTFHPRIITKGKEASGTTDACTRLYVQGQERSERQTQRIRAKEQLEREREEREIPTFRPSLVTSTKRRAELQRDVFSNLYNDAVRLSRRRDAREAQGVALDAFQPQLSTKSRNARTDLVRSIVDQLSQFT
ncbi:hypothetical protein GMRT_12405 [Giardia muris]|uniref:Uncharacterized protein n=1 Tax=Giardia muris TaxID=5742 RepID=A0A4Z1SUF8_GIAMU|nr:hypothetical protein GMRT_12405 [Giardia muris]|eukprot:TNJ27238.1 hypothetical protein GMRT_12405 [Giardia muris]